MKIMSYPCKPQYNVRGCKLHGRVSMIVHLLFGFYMRTMSSHDIFDTSIYILQIAVTMDESFEVTLTFFRDAKNIKGYNKPTLFSSPEPKAHR